MRDTRSAPPHHRRRGVHPDALRWSDSSVSSAPSISLGNGRGNRRRRITSKRRQLGGGDFFDGVDQAIEVERLREMDREPGFIALSDVFIPPETTHDNAAQLLIGMEVPHHIQTAAVRKI